jgi:O-antigen/teichoic acid export membrane protein
MAREILHFGRWIFVSTVFTFLAGQADRLVLGRMATLEMFGVFTVAALIASVPSNAFSQIGRVVYFPIFSRVVARGEDLAAAFRHGREPLLIGCGWAICGLVAGGPTIVRVLYSSEYRDAGWILQILAMGVWLLLLATVGSVALLAKGQSKQAAAAAVAKVVALVALIPVGYWLDGFRGAIVASTSTEVCRYVVINIAMKREGLTGWRRDVVLTTLLVVSALTIERVSAMLAGDSVAGNACLVALFATLAWLPLGWRHLRRLAHRT